MKTKTFIVILFLLLGTACTTAPPTLPQVVPTESVIVAPASPTETAILKPTSPAANLPLTEADVPRVTVENAKAALDAGVAIIVDVRSKEAYDASHIAGALFIPLADMESKPDQLGLNKDQWIITYCT